MPARRRSLPPDTEVELAMKSILPTWLVAGLAVVIGGPAQAQAPKTAAGSSSYKAQVAPIVAKYCVGCHGAEKPKGGVNLAAFATEGSALKDLKTWERVLEAVRGGEMPPDDRPQPSGAEAASFTQYLESLLSKASCKTVQDPGRVTLRRLNREEYNNTIRDLVGVDFRPADDFPSDDVGYGFDNIGDVLTLPPLLMEKYLAAAESITEQAILADDQPRGPTRRFKAEEVAKPGSGHVDGESGFFLMSSNNEVGVDHAFTKSGQYLLRARVYGQQAGKDLPKLEFLIDGKPARAFEVKAEQDDPAVFESKVKIKMPVSRFAAAFTNDAWYPDVPDPRKRDRNLAIEWIEVVGPMYSLPNDLPESHKKIIFHRPTLTTRREVAREVLQKLATRAFRRPVTPSELDRLVGLVDMTLKNGDKFERGIQVAMQAILVSPHFLFRVELDSRPGAPKLLNDLELASRLSYFLWSSMPDDELLDLATKGQLRSAKNLDLQVARMLKDPKSKEFVENFAGQWLQTRNLKLASPDRGRFGAFDEPLRQAMAREVDLFFAAVVQDDRPISDFLQADYTFLNERLARHYGIAGVTGDKFRRVHLTDRSRGGVVTMASTLTVTSNPTRTSPVKRGKWILEEILGTPPPPPPPNVADLSADDTDDKGRRKDPSTTLRTRLEKHRADPNCASCHSRMDPLGFGLENFDAIGAWRDKDGPFPIDSKGTLPGGQSFAGPVELKAVLMTRIKPFSRCLTEKLMTYALGRGLEYQDRCVVEKVADSVLADGGKFSRLVSGIVHSDPFQKRGVEGSASP
jgi:mono/diheme cytochrome c family protein